VPSRITRPDYAADGIPKKKKNSLLTRKKDILRMKAACVSAAEVLAEVGSAVRIGITTDELDLIAHEACIKKGGYPSPLNYHKFPKSLCTSVNEVICHGIPAESCVLRSGDIINCDVTIFTQGYHGDCSATFYVGEVEENRKLLVEAAKESLEIGIAAVRPGSCVSEVGKAIENYIKHNTEFSIVEQFAGHGIGEVFHSKPSVLHYYDSQQHFILVDGMTITIEPMINMGLKDGVFLSDGWTYRTKDGLPSAQFEHTLLVTKRGCKILTAI